jgi:hypothetical protein
MCPEGGKFSKINLYYFDWNEEVKMFFRKVRITLIIIEAAFSSETSVTYTILTQSYIQRM